MICVIKKVCTLIFWYPKGPILVPFWAIVAKTSFCPQILSQNIKCKKNKGAHDIFYHKSVHSVILVPKRPILVPFWTNAAKFVFCPEILLLKIN